jgi:hypothetical protein
MIVPTLCVGMHLATLRLALRKSRIVRLLRGAERPTGIPTQSLGTISFLLWDRL